MAPAYDFHMTANDMNSVVLPDGRVARVRKFHQERFARDASRPGTGDMLVLGDVNDKWGRFWVCSPRDASRLVRAGYEYAPVAAYWMNHGF